MTLMKSKRAKKDHLRPKHPRPAQFQTAALLDPFSSTIRRSATTGLPPSATICLSAAAAVLTGLIGGEYSGSGSANGLW
jgi:hypothetical protein